MTVVTSWELLPKGYVDPPEPDWAEEMNQAVKDCPGHLWELLLEDSESVDLHCERCPACVDDLYPDGHEMIYYTSEDGSIVIDSGSHNLEDDATPVRIPVNARVLSGYNYWGEYDAELIIEPRSPDEAPSLVGDSS